MLAVAAFLFVFHPLWILTFDTANKPCGCDGSSVMEVRFLFCHVGQRESKQCGEVRIQYRLYFPGSSSIRWWWVGDEKIITLWLLTFPCMISCWHNSITLSNKPFQKQLEPDFNWAANQLLLALIWLSQCWIAFDAVRHSRWDNHSRYPRSSHPTTQEIFLCR